MKALFAILGYFYNSMPVTLRVITLLAALAFLPTVFIDASETKTILRTLSISFSLGLTFIVSVFSSFWHLISNQRLSSVPGFRLLSGTAMLAFTLIVALGFSTIQSPSGEVQAFSDFLRNFIAASAILGYAVLLRKGPAYFVIGLLIFSPAMYILQNEYILTNINSVILPGALKYFFLLATITGWAYGLHTVNTKKIFHGTPFSRIKQLSIINAQRKSEKSDQKKPSKFVFIRHLKRISAQNIFKEERIQRAHGSNGKNGSNESSISKALPKILTNFSIPLWVTFVLFTFNFIIAQLTTASTFIGELSFFELYLAISLYVPFYLLSYYSNQVGQCRKLWLKTSGDRLQFWNTIELEFKSDAKTMLFNTIFNTAIAFIFTDWSTLNCMIYASMVFIIIAYIAYIGIISGCKGWNDIGSSIIVQMPIILFITLMASPAHNIPLFSVGVVAGLTLVIILLRAYARHNFLKVDWFRLTPHIQSKTLRHHIQNDVAKMTR